MKLLTSREKWLSCSAQPGNPSACQAVGEGCACPPDGHTAAKLRTPTPTTAFLHWVRNKCFGTRKILTHLGRQLLRNESGEPKKAVQHLRRGSKMPGTWPGDSRGGAKGGERSSACVPVQSEE